MSKNPLIGQTGAQEVSVGVAIEIISRLRGTLFDIKAHIVDIEPTYEGTSKSPSRFALVIHNLQQSKTSYFIVSSDGAVIASADTQLFNKLHHDPMNGYMSQDVSAVVHTPSTLTLSDLFEKTDEYSEQFLNDQIDLIAQCSHEVMPIDRTRLYLFSRALEVDNPTVVINGIYAFLDTIPGLFETYPDDIGPAFIHLHGAVLLIVQAANTVNQSYIDEALRAIEELEQHIESLKGEFLSSSLRIGQQDYANEVKKWVDRYDSCLAYAFARIRDHRTLRDTGAVEPQKMVSSMSNPWRSSYIGEYERAWEAKMLEPAGPSSIENTTLSNAVEILQIDRMLDSMRRKGIEVSNPIDAVKHIIGFEPGNVATEVCFKNLMIKTSQSFFGLRINGQPLIRDSKNESLLYATLDGKQLKFHAAYPQQTTGAAFRIMIIHPKELSEDSISVAFDSVVLAKDPESANITIERKKVPYFESNKTGS